MLLGGDFKQTLPVISHANRAAITESTIKHSPVWSSFRHLHLQQNMRTTEDQVAFANWMQQLGASQLLLHRDLGEDAIEVPSKCIEQGSLIDAVYTEDDFLPQNAQHLASKAILCPKNEDSL